MTPSSTPRRYRWLKKIFFVLAALLTLLLLLLAVENWRGKRAWRNYVAEFQARGEPLYLKDVVPPPIPDSRNAVAIPVWTNLFSVSNSGASWKEHWPEKLGRANTLLRRFLGDEGQDAVGPAQWDSYSLAAWAVALRHSTNLASNAALPASEVQSFRQGDQSPQVILEELQVYEPVLSQIREAADRPEARFPVDYDTPNPAMILLPHLASLKGVCQALALQAVAHAAAGNPEAAQADLFLILHQAETLRDEPILISFLVRVACWNLALRACQAAWELGPAWSDEALQLWQNRLGQVNFLKEWHRSIMAERCFGNGVFDFIIRGNKREMLQLFGNGDGDGGGAGVLASVPAGWLRFEQVSYNRLFDSWLNVQIDQQGARVSPAAVDAAGKALEKQLQPGFKAVLDHRIFAGLLLPAVTKTLERAAEAQARFEMGALAAALERHRLAHQSYPESLSALVPEYVASLPSDIVSDQPYRYILKSPDTYLLYSIGWNEADDGGTETKDARNARRDWVWRNTAP